MLTMKGEGGGAQKADVWVLYSIGNPTALVTTDDMVDMVDNVMVDETVRVKRRKSPPPHSQFYSSQIL